MSKTITYELNDNVVSKLQEIVGGETDPYLTSARQIYDAVNGKNLNFDKLVNFLNKYDLYPAFTESNYYEVNAVRFSHYAYEYSALFGVKDSSDAAVFLLFGDSVSEDSFNKSYMESHFSNMEVSNLFDAEILSEDVLPKFYLFAGSLDSKILPQDFFDVWE
jgi:hypothetical protein